MQWLNAVRLLWQTRRDARIKAKVVVFESDDWGSQRMPSKEAYSIMLKKGYPVDKRVFERYDTLESESDVTALAEVLARHKSSNGINPVFTLNLILHNPDFEAIRKSNFTLHHTEFFTRTYSRLYKGDVPSVMGQAMREGLFRPQLHGYVHYQTNRWMHQLQDPTSDARAAFEVEMVGVPSTINPSKGNTLMIALAADNAEDVDLQVHQLQTSVDEFSHHFGFKPTSYIAPVYTWYDQIEEVLASNGIQFLQGGRMQQIQHFQSDKKQKNHFTGESNRFKQRYMVRTIFFEPVYNPTPALVDHCMQRIKVLIDAGIPVTISTHRINYTGGLDLAHRDKNLLLLSELLKRIIAKWPDVEFISSDQLGKNLEHD